MKFVHDTPAERVARSLWEIALACERWGSQNLNGSWRILQHNEPMGALPELPHIRIIVEETA